jgi:hypothetical protein
MSPVRSTGEYPHVSLRNQRQLRVYPHWRSTVRRSIESQPRDEWNDGTPTSILKW